MIDDSLPIIDTTEAFQQCIAEHRATLIWFTGPDCRVCQDLKPKIAQLISEQFPQIHCFQVDCAASPALSAQRQIFTVPTLLVYLEGQEFIRLSRSFSPAQLAAELDRPYRLLFS
ncbi:MAG: thioredoxin family protein [Chromatiales bacterium]|nr:thioredoxin family protein [Chromatiales bacterium]